jgi:hypothetical protein
MVQFNFSERTIKAKVVYYGPPQSGKTTNLEQIHRITDPDGNNRLISLNTAQDRTLFFDLLPFSLGTVSGYDFKIQLYTVPGQVQYNATRRVVLAGADAVVFVADSQRTMARENVSAFENMKVNLLANRLVPEKVPLVVQYNKQDLPGLQTREELDRALNFWGRKAFPAVASRGEGVIDTFVAVVQDMLAAIAVKYNLKDKGLDPESVPQVVAEAFDAILKRSPSAPSSPPIPPGAAATHARVVISQPIGAEAAYPGQVGPEVNPVSEELLHRAIRSNVELAEALGQVVRDVNASLATIQAQADGLDAGAAPASTAAAIRAEAQRVRRALLQLAPAAARGPASRAPAPPLAPPTPARPFSPARQPPSPATVSVSRAQVTSRPPVVSGPLGTIPPGARVTVRPPAPSAPDAPARSSAVPPGTVTAPPLAGAPARPVPPPSAPAAPSAPPRPAPSAPAAPGPPPSAPGPATSVDVLLVEVVRGLRAVFAARPVGVESRIAKGTPLPRCSPAGLRAALVGALEGAATTARPSSVISARAEKKPVLLRGRDGAEVRRDFLMLALTQQGGPGEAEQRAVLAGSASGPLAVAHRHVRELGGFLRFAPLPGGALETRLFLPG